jgi:serine palmitoyltransferase
VQAALRRGGIALGATRVNGGTTSIHENLEARVAKFVGKEAALFLGMGYATNSSVLPILCSKGDLIISDALNHSSIVVGARGSGAKVKVFKHNNAKHLDRLLRAAIAEGQPRTHRPWRKILIVVEGIYSMEGEVGPELQRCRLDIKVQSGMC